ncbi:MAG: accessory gene regulator B family protein [Clostridia bacterium]|nr:accessory gene regulator B family protein [Clostridia bacterium]
MYARGLKRIGQKLADLGVLDSEQIPVFQYGLDSLLGSVWNYGCLLLIGLAMGQLLDMCLWIVAYTVLRQHAGGYHATTRTRCFVFTQLIGVVSLLAMRVAPTWLCLALPIVGAGLVFGLAPVEHKNHPLNPKRRVRQWKLARIAACAEVLVVVACWLWWPRGLAPLAIGMGTAAAMMGLAALLKLPAPLANKG